MAPALRAVSIWTDGSADKDGIGGWAAYLSSGLLEKLVSGSAVGTTSSRMELEAALRGLRMLNWRCDVTLYSDSAYLVNCFKQGWIRAWRRNGWITSNKTPVANRDLWEALDAEVKKHRVVFEKVAGHSGDLYNDRVDRAAWSARRRRRTAIREEEALGGVGISAPPEPSGSQRKEDGEVPA